MSDILSKGSLFPEELIPDFIKKTTGASALAKLCSATPIPFNGVKEFTFSLDKEVDIVAENGAKTKGGLTVDPITIVPIKIEYGARISDEFLYASEDAQLDYMSAFADGFAKKVAKGLDLMAFHGVNPRTGTASSVIGTNHFDSKVTQAVTIASGDKPDENIEAAIALVQGADRDVTGMVLAPAFKSALAKQTTADGAKLYPQLAWGANPGEVNGLRVDECCDSDAWYASQSAGADIFLPAHHPGLPAASHSVGWQGKIPYSLSGIPSQKRSRFFRSWSGMDLPPDLDTVFQRPE